jgi:hypothetical protein
MKGIDKHWLVYSLVTTLGITATTSFSGQAVAQVPVAGGTPPTRVTESSDASDRTSTSKPTRRISSYSRGYQSAPTGSPGGAQPGARAYQVTASGIPFPRNGDSFPQGVQPTLTAIPVASQQLTSGVPSYTQSGMAPLKTLPGSTVPETSAYGPGGTGVPGQMGAPGAPLPTYPGASPVIPGIPGGPGTGPVPGSAPAEGVGPPAGDAALGALAGDVSADLGGDSGVGAGMSNTPFMIGDQGPFSALTRFPPVPGPFPPGRPVPGSSPYSKFNHSVNAVVPAVRGFKIADNQSPRPMDRVFVDFNYYDNVNSALNRRLNAPIGNMQVYHELFGVEKTFFDGNASLGLRIPINSLSVDSSFPGLGGSHTAAGNLAVFGKYVLYQDDGGNLLSAGLSIDTPTGPASFAGVPVRSAQNSVGIQPFLGYILKGEQWFLQGFGSIDVPTASAMPTMMYLDAGIGYFLYRTQEQRFLTAIIPTYELHMNIPLNHSGYSNTDSYGVPPVLDMTFGVNFGLLNSAYLTTAYVVPVTGPQPFSGEFVLQFNWLFGRSRRAGIPAITPPVTGG